MESLRFICKEGNEFQGNHLLLKSQKIRSERFGKITGVLKNLVFVYCVFTIYLFRIY